MNQLCLVSSWLQNCGDINTNLLCLTSLWLWCLCQRQNSKIVVTICLLSPHTSLPQDVDINVLRPALVSWRIHPGLRPRLSFLSCKSSQGSPNKPSKLYYLPITNFFPVGFQEMLKVQSQRCPSDSLRFSKFMKQAFNFIALYVCFHVSIIQCNLCIRLLMTFL